MQIPKRVLVCTDLSDYSAEVISAASMLKKTWRCDAILLNVINQREVDALQAANVYIPNRIDIEDHFEKIAVDRKKAIRDQITSMKARDLVDSPIISRIGYPSEEIVQAIETEDIDLVILGRKGRTNLAGVLFGSTAERVFKHTKIPVLIVQSPQ